MTLYMHTHNGSLSFYYAPDGSSFFVIHNPTLSSFETPNLEEAIEFYNTLSEKS